MIVCKRVSPILLASAVVLFSAEALASDDVDGDGVPNVADNCLQAPNPGQLDTDGDGFGNACDPDLDNNGVVNFTDLQQMQLAFFSNPASPSWNPDADFNGDNIVNFPDLQLMQSYFFGPPGPSGFAQWVSPNSGNWNEPANWFPAAVPVAVQSVLIDVPGIVITHDSGDNECASVISEADIVLTGGSTLSVNGTMDMRGDLTLAGNNTTLRNAAIVRTVGSGSPLTLAPIGALTFDNVRLAVDMVVPDGVFLLHFRNGLTLDNASLTLAADGEFLTRANFLGTQTLGGTGEILFAGTTTDDTVNRLGPGAGSVLTIGPGITTRTITAAGGELGSNVAGRGLVMLGDVVADIPGARLTVHADSLTIDGSLAASNGAIISVAGNWTASDTATITATGGSDLELFGNWTSAATITITDGLLDIGNNEADTWNNLGTISLIDSDAELGGVFGPDNFGSMSSDGNTLLNGRLVLTDRVFDIDAAPGTWQLGANGVIQDGTVTGTLLDVVGHCEFDGTTLAVDTVIGNHAIVTVFNGLTLGNASLTLASDGGFTGAVFQGTQTLGGTGEILFAGSSTDDTRNRLRSGGGAVLTIGPDITARTVTAAGGLLGGFTHGVVMHGNVVAETAGAKLTVQGIPLTIDGNFEASNGGKISVAGDWTASNATAMTVTNGSELELFGRWTSEAMIAITDGLLDIGNNNNFDTWTNLGTIDLIDSNAELGGLFVLDDLGMFTSDAAVIIDGELDNTGLILDLDTVPGVLELGSGGIIVGGTVTGTSFDISGTTALDGVNLAVDTTFYTGTATITNDLTLDNVSVTLASSGNPAILHFPGSQTLGGNGEILFGGTTTSDTANRIEPQDSGDFLTIGPTITIRPITTGGRVGSPGRQSRLLGSLVSDMPGEVVAVYGSPFTNDGSIVIDTGSVITGAPNYVQGANGSLTVEIGGTSIAEFGRLAFTGTGSSTALNGTLNIGLTGFSPGFGDTFRIIAAATRSGTFTTVTGTDAGAGLTVVPIYNSDNVTLQVQ